MTDPDLKKLYWHSRRGMLELDLVLVPFAETVLPTLSGEQRQVYRELLDHEDQDLYTWLVGRAPAPDERLQQMVTLVRRYRQSNTAV